jgi:hypothetical protein
MVGMGYQYIFKAFGLIPKGPRTSEIPSLRETIIKYNLEEYFGIDVQYPIISDATFDKFLS